jgi:hypothetical protein
MDGKTGNGRDRQGALSRQNRLAAQLRSNLARRKAQARTRQTSAGAGGPDREPSPDIDASDPLAES